MLRCVAALRRFGELPACSVAPRLLVEALVGWLDVSRQPASNQKLISHFVQTVLTYDPPVLHEAIRRTLAPRGMLAELSAVSGSTWAVCKECYVASLFVARRPARAALEGLLKEETAPLRATVEAAFGLALPRISRLIDSPSAGSSRRYLGIIAYCY